MSPDEIRLLLADTSTRDYRERRARLGITDNRIYCLYCGKQRPKEDENYYIYTYTVCNTCNEADSELGSKEWTNFPHANQQLIDQLYQGQFKLCPKCESQLLLDTNDYICEKCRFGI